MNDLMFRDAREDELPQIVAMLADDGLGGGRERVQAEGVDPAYVAAFREIAAQTGNRIVVVEHGGELIGTYQFMLLPGLSHAGARRAQIEAVRVRADRRGSGVGELMLRHAIAEARAAGCRIIQLTSDKRRGRAHLFYERLGFVGTHFGYKMEVR